MTPSEITHITKILPHYDLLYDTGVQFITWSTILLQTYYQALVEHYFNATNYIELNIALIILIGLSIPDTL